MDETGSRAPSPFPVLTITQITMEFLSKLQAINFNNYNSDGDLCNGDWTLHYRYKMNSGIDLLESVQLVVTIKYKGSNAKTWGCMKDDQQAIVKYILEAEERASQQEWDDEEEGKRIAREAFRLG